MTHVKLRIEKGGGHYHVAVFTSRHVNGTYARCGDLCFDEREWPEVSGWLQCSTPSVRVQVEARFRDEDVPNEGVPDAP